ncbi:L,D-transpeptidase family protein [Streptomyces sp. NPDC051956]|uniref:L,D-transpeptidase family protein n=1 Tax=Streptomyces sp. NPDC051956 TaxID=3365677 RepID=UPI0037D53602
MRATVMRGSLAVAGVIALAGGCRTQAVDTGGKQPPPRAHGSASPAPSDDAKEPGAKKPGAAPSRTPSVRPTPPPKVLMARGASGGKVRELQARLRQIAWLFEGPNGKYGPATTKAVEGFQGKRGLPRTGNTDTVTWARLVRMTHAPTRDELYASGGQPAAKPDRRCMTGRVVCISKTSRTLTWMIDGKALMTTDVRFGSQFTPTREGVFSVYWKSRHHVSTIYHSPMPYAMFFSGGQAVHYSADFAARGYTGASHGCVNVRDEGKIASLFAQVRTGDRVVVYW